MSLWSVDWIDFWNNIFWLGNTIFEIVIESIELVMMRVKYSKTSKIVSIMQSMSDLPI